MSALIISIRNLGVAAVATEHRIIHARFGKFVTFFVLSVCSYFFFSHLIVTAVEVKGSSMTPTLHSGDRVLLNRFTCLHRAPLRGELVVLKDPEIGELVVKRVVALPEESVCMNANFAVVNGHQLREPYLVRNPRHVEGSPTQATVVPKGHFYVLGDNRSNSVDSRAFGPVKREAILGVIHL